MAKGEADLDLQRPFDSGRKIDLSHYLLDTNHRSAMTASPCHHLLMSIGSGSRHDDYSFRRLTIRNQRI